jgi:hypothetical protein
VRKPPTRTKLPFTVSSASSTLSPLAARMAMPGDAAASFCEIVWLG